MSEIRRYANREALGKAAAEIFYMAANKAIKERGRFTVALSGGSTPISMHQQIAANFAKQIDWRYVHIFWSDERHVPAEHQDSNYKMAKKTLLDHILISEENVHRILTEKDAKDAAIDYDKTLRTVLGDEKEIPVLDLVWLGLGNDGHTASLFPHTTALQAENRLVVANFVPKLDTWRVTFTAPLIEAAHQIIFLVSGEDKANILREVINGPHMPETYPAQMIEPIDGELIWMIDKAAGTLI